MNSHKVVRDVSFFFCRLVPYLVLLCLSFQAKAEVSQPAFWEVRKGDSVLYLMGSMHFGHPDFYPMPKTIEDAFAKADRLVVEVNLLNLSPQAAQIVFKHGGLQQGQTLKDVISPSTYRLLQNHVQKTNVPINAFHRFQPWYVTLLLVETEIRKTELQQQLGVDLYFLKKASGTEKPIDELETLESQLSLFSTFSLKEQERFLRQTLQDLQNGRDYLTKMAEAWRQGNVGVLERTLIEPFRAQKDSQQLFDRMFTRRNKKMVSAVERYLQKGQRVFLVVGVGHMLGDDGIVSLLQRRGIQVERVLSAAPQKNL